MLVIFYPGTGRVKLMKARLGCSENLLNAFPPINVALLVADCPELIKLKAQFPHDIADDDCNPYLVEIQLPAVVVFGCDRVTVAIAQLSEEVEDLIVELDAAGFLI